MIGTVIKMNEPESVNALLICPPHNSATVIRLFVIPHLGYRGRHLVCSPCCRILLVLLKSMIAILINFQNLEPLKFLRKIGLGTFQTDAFG